jgi:hypothetical protein
MAAISVSGPAGSVGVFVTCAFVCDNLITLSEESYRVCVILCDLRISKIRRPTPNLCCCTTKENRYITAYYSY